MRKQTDLRKAVRAGLFLVREPGSGTVEIRGRRLFLDPLLPKAERSRLVDAALMALTTKSDADPILMG